MDALTYSEKLSVMYGQKHIDFSLFFCDRKTMEIAVHPDCTVIVKAPMHSDMALIEKKVVKRAPWIIQQLKYFKQFNPRTPQRYYVTGETHLYLGRQYRIKTSRGVENSVKLSCGYFYVTSQNEPTPDMTRKLLNQWYLNKAKFQFEQSLERCWIKFNAFNVSKPELSIKRMKKRWGSLSNKGTITLNTDLIKAPKECIDYVVSHELCHLKHHNHSQDFYTLLNHVFPNWEKTKHKLELNMM